MADLVFRTSSELKEVIELRKEIEKLKKEIMSLNQDTSSDAVVILEVQLSSARQRMEELVLEAAHAGIVMEGLSNINNDAGISFSKVFETMDNPSILENIASGVVDVSAEFQQLETSFVALLQSKEKAGALMSQSYFEKEKEAWNNYLSEYGTFQEKKQAIMEHYNRKMSTASTNGEKEIFRIEMESKLDALNFEEIQSSLNFADIFEDLDAQSSDIIVQMHSKFEEIINASAQDLKPADLKSLQDSLKNLDLKVANKNPFEEFKTGIDNYKKSTESLRKAQSELNIVQKGGEVITGYYLSKTGEICKKLLTQEQAEKNLTDAQQNRTNAQTQLTKSVKSIGSNGKLLVDAGNSVCSMLTNLGIQVPESITGALSGIGQVMDSLTEIDLTKPFSIAKGVAGVLSGLSKTIGSLFGLGGEDSMAKYKLLKEQLLSINKIYNGIFEKSSKEIKFGNIKSVEEYSKGIDALNKQIENYRNLAVQRGETREGKNHSFDYKMNNRMWYTWDDISSVAKQSVSSVQDMYGLSVKQLEDIRTKLPHVWSELDEDVRNYFDSIIEAGGKTEELADMLNTALTGVDYDSFYNGFINNLADMDMSFEDMCDNFEDYLRKSIMAAIVASNYQDRINRLYQHWSNAANSDAKITETEADDLRKEYNDIIQDMVNEREGLMETFGWASSEAGKSSSQQEASKRGFETMSQDTASELNGRFTALQIAGEETKNQNILQTDALNLLNMKADTIMALNIDTHNIADEIRAVQVNSYLELVGIRDNTNNTVKQLKIANEKLLNIENNTKNL